MHDAGDSATLDEAALEELREDLGDAFAPFVAQFLVNARDSLERMSSAAEAAEWTAVAEHAHRLRGTAAYLGAAALAAALADLQRTAEASAGDRVTAALARTGDALQRVSPLLEARASG